MVNVFQNLVRYYDEFQAKLFDYAMEIEIIHNVLKRNFVKKVVDVGCGTGTHLIGLAKVGYECVGIDTSVEMLRKAREKAEGAFLNVKFMKADIRDTQSLREQHGKFDASIWIRNTLPSIDDMKRALKTQYDLLKNKGVIIFDLLQANGNICEDEIFNMDVVRRDNEIVVRLNDFKIKRSEVEYESVYFIRSKRGVRIVPDRLVLPLVTINEVREILAGLGFGYECIVYEYAGIPKTKSIMIFARKELNIG